MHPVNSLQKMLKKAYGECFVYTNSFVLRIVSDSLSEVACMESQSSALWSRGNNTYSVS